MSTDMSEDEARRVRLLLRDVREIVERYGAQSDDAAWAWQTLHDALGLR